MTMTTDNKTTDEILPRKTLGLGRDLKPIGTKKLFAKPFRLVFKRVEDQAITWIEVESSNGLKTVVDRLAKAELVPVNAYATLSLQLWALLAEHVGFLRFQGPEGHLNAGLEPLGAEQAELVGDMTELFGGFDPALEALTSMRDSAVKKQEDAAGDGPSFFKVDGVNLTPEGEKELASEVYGTVGDANVSVKMETATAEALLAETEVEDAVDHFKADTAARDKTDFKTITGAEAEEIGRKVEKAAEGDLEDEEEIE